MRLRVEQVRHSRMLPNCTITLLVTMRMKIAQQTDWGEVILVILHLADKVRVKSVACTRDLL